MWLFTRFFFIIIVLVYVQYAYAQDTLMLKKDTLLNNTKTKTTTKPTIPKIAAKRSAIMPGWGQVYNHKIWKVPIVYAALGVTGGIFASNIVWYKRVRYATKIAYNIRDKTVPNPINPSQLIPDSTGFSNVHPRLKGLIGNVNTLVNYRSSFRQNVDYSALFFILAWGLNVIDATVDAHLSSFDVSDQLSLHLKPIIPNNTNYGLGFAIGISKPKQKILPLFN
jgi:hypothetical protein